LSWPLGKRHQRVSDVEESGVSLAIEDSRWLG
jgi:hypothetical protein